jgi:energy-coupling factor transporter ATP-binding protein EcfA2
LLDLGFNIHIPEMDIRHRRIGSPEQKVLSGGQRKRINVAQELITNPKILFLDEPTSGLAAKDAKELIKLLKVLSERDRVAVILTIHQPSYELFSMFSNTLLLTPGGIQAYFGSAVPGSFDYLQLDKHNPDDLLDKVDVPFPENQQLKKRYRQSPYYQTFITNRQKSRAQTQEIEQKDWRRPGIRQFLTLTARNFKLKWKDLWGGTGILLLQAPIIAFLVFVALNNTKNQVEQTKVLFLLIISAIWFGCNNSAREIVAEKLIYSRERMVNLKIPSYFLSKLVIMTILCGFQCFVLLACNYGSCNLPGSFLSLYGVLLLTALSAACMGLFLSAIVKTNEAAIGMVPILLLPQVILAGMLVKLGTNKLIDLLAKLTISRWSYEAMLNISFPEVLASNIVPRQEGTFIEYLGFAENRLGMDSFVLVWITCFFLMSSFLLLYLRDNNK